MTGIERRLAQTRQRLEAKKEARRRRRHLKESGDYLGVQGINPLTGRLDVITPTSSDRSSTSHENQQRLHDLRSALEDARHTYRQARAEGEKEAKRILESETHKLRRLEKDKQGLRNLSQRVRWRRQTKQWSSAQEPELSPIAQSRVGSTLGSRKSSKYHSLKYPSYSIPKTPHAVGRKLVEMSSPEEPTTTPAHKKQPREARIEASSSTATVIRTPHRQSTADATSSAWELYANGISFTDPESLMSRDGQGEPKTASSAGHGDGFRSAVPRRSQSGPPDGVVFSPDDAARPPTRTGGQSLKEELAAPSFLDIQLKTLPEPGGRKAKNRLPLPGDERTAEAGRPRYRAPQAVPGLANENTNPSTGQDRGSAARYPAIRHADKAWRAEAMHVDHLSGDAAQKAGTRSSLRKLISPLGNLRIKRADGRRAHPGAREEAPRPGSQEIKPWREATTRAEGAITGENPAAPTDRPTLEECRLWQADEDTDDEWLEKALRDIAEMGNQILLEESASTHITTITGLEPAEAEGCVAFGKSATEYLAELGGGGAGRSNRYYVHGTPGRHGRADGGLGCAGREAAQHITHINVYAAEGNVLRRPAAGLSRGGSETSEVQKSGERRSVKRQMPGAFPGLSDDEDDGAPARGLGGGAGRTSGGETERTGERGAQQPDKGAARESVEGQRGDAEQARARPMPGAFPAEVDGEGSPATASRDGAWGVLSTGKPAARLLSLYLATIGPVFNSRSEYWTRNARQESTVADVAAMALAMPAAMLGAAALV
ncbi:hypothetical protein CDD83_7747 [Cordyceps sp. RAO-2017]|nr:hypothetical protein CDD83_7747 [Cordyceps sp. RAO-2017]